MADQAARVLDLLRAAGRTVATAESLTGGRLAARLTAVPGSSDAYVGGVVSYATALKVSLLEVPQALADRHGVVSAECARAMAEGVRRATGASYGVSTTGVAGPGPQDGVPAGTVYVGLAGPDGSAALALELPGGRHTVQDRTCEEALSAFADMLAGNTGAGNGVDLGVDQGGEETTLG
ncbi:CinA family protein [Nocardioides sp. GCM10027113]|uniref:CinA family protein n=1 Tax=unclassified Nocardioides TaxID=2615069 RepID=UPI00360B84AC